MRAVAADEANHAQLSWRVALWLDEQLDHNERAIVESHRGRTLAGLADEACPREWERSALPSPEITTAIAASLASGMPTLAASAMVA